MRQSRLSEHQANDVPSYKNEHLLRELYLNQELSSYEVAEELDCHPSTVQRYLREYEIPRRGPNGSKSDALYKQESWLREQYVEAERSAYDIAEELEISTTTVYVWLEKNGIERRVAASEVPKGAPYADREWLYQKYCEEEKGTYEIGEMTGVHPGTIGTWLHKFEIPVRDEGRPPLPFARKYVDSNGYVLWRNYNREQGTDEYVPVHRLLAVAHYGFDAVKGMHVHHKNHVKWDNRIENLELKEPEEHAKYHAKLENEHRERGQDGRFLPK